MIKEILSSSVKVNKAWSFTSVFSFIVMVCSLGKKETLLVPNTIAFPELFQDSLSIPTQYTWKMPGLNAVKYLLYTVVSLRLCGAHTTYLRRLHHHIESPCHDFINRIMTYFVFQKT
jgi:hypothetical protein